MSTALRCWVCEKRCLQFSSQPGAGIANKNVPECAAFLGSISIEQMRKLALGTRLRALL
jgi:hypothetical protein